MFSVLTSLHSVQNVTLSAQNVTLSAQNVTLSAQNVTLSAQNVTLSAQNVILLIIGRYYKTLSTKLSIPFPERFFCSNSKIRNKKNRKKNYEICKKNLCPDPVSGPVRSGQPDRESRSGPVRSGFENPDPVGS